MSMASETNHRSHQMSARKLRVRKHNIAQHIIKIRQPGATMGNPQMSSLDPSHQRMDLESSPPPPNLDVPTASCLLIPTDIYSVLKVFCINFTGAQEFQKDMNQPLSNIDFQIQLRLLHGALTRLLALWKYSFPSSVVYLIGFKRQVKVSSSTNSTALVQICQILTHLSQCGGSAILPAALGRNEVNSAHCIFLRWRYGRTLIPKTLYHSNASKSCHKPFAVDFQEVKQPAQSIEQAVSIFGRELRAWKGA